MQGGDASLLEKKRGPKREETQKTCPHGDLERGNCHPFLSNLVISPMKRATFGPVSALHSIASHTLCVFGDVLGVVVVMHASLCVSFGPPRHHSGFDYRQVC